MHKQKITEANFTDKCRSPSPLSGHCIEHTLPQLSQAVDRSQAIRWKHWRGWALGTVQYAQVVMGTVGIWLIDILMNVDECWWQTIFQVNEPNLAFCARLLRIYPQEASDTFKHQSHHIWPFWLALKQSVLTASRNPQRCSGRRQRQSWRVMLQRS